MSKWAAKQKEHGSVSYWNCLVQNWECMPAEEIEDHVLATLTEEDRALIARVAAENAQ